MLNKTIAASCLIVGLYAGNCVGSQRNASNENTALPPGKTEVILNVTSEDAVEILPTPQGSTVTQTREKNACIASIKSIASAFQIPAKRLQAIAMTETGGVNNEPYPWSINVEGRGMKFKTKKEAIAATVKLMRRGYKSIDVGCMQVNLMYHPAAFKEKNAAYTVAALQKAFDPYENVLYATEHLAELANQHGSIDKATKCYHNCADKTRQAQYIKKVKMNEAILQAKRAS